LAEKMAADFGIPEIPPAFAAPGDVAITKTQHAVIDGTQALIAKLGERFRYVGNDLDRRLCCSRCGEKGVSVQIHNMNSSRSRFAD